MQFISPSGIDTIYKQFIFMPFENSLLIKYNLRMDHTNPTYYLLFSIFLLKEYKEDSHLGSPYTM